MNKIIFLKQKIYYNSFKSFSKQIMPTKLKRKFYKTIDIIEVENDNYNKEDNITNYRNNPDISHIKNFIGLSNIRDKYYHILLDGKKLKTVHLDELKIPNKLLAVAMAEEWEKQTEFINMHSMHLVIFIINHIELLCSNWDKVK